MKSLAATSLRQTSRTSKDINLLHQLAGRQGAPEHPYPLGGLSPPAGSNALLAPREPGFRSWTREWAADLKLLVDARDQSARVRHGRG